MDLRYHLITYGCQMNKADSERLGGSLEALGYTWADEPMQADLVVVNTCAVRQSAENRALGQLGWLAGMKKKNPQLSIAMMGCMVGEDSLERLQARLPQVDVFTKPVEYEPILEFAQQKAGNRGMLDEGCLEGSPLAIGGPCRWVPVIYGCNMRCAFCIVPIRRGAERSRPIPEVVRELRWMVRHGTREVTLLGQTVDDYGRDLEGRPDLADLLTACSEVPGLERIRFLTSHPLFMSDRIIEAVGSLPNVCEHFNIAVQSGDDIVLRRMKRGYPARRYVDLVARIRDIIPHASIATDIIVGFPGESEQQFQNSLAMLEQLELDVVHVAMYSPRPGTKAGEEMADDVPREMKHQRLLAVEALQERIVSAKNMRLRGRTLDVLVEGQKNGKWWGRIRTDRVTFFTDPRENLVGQILPVRIDDTTAYSLRGIAVA